MQSFMFETSLGLGLTEWGEKTCCAIDEDYFKCWQPLIKHFDPNWKQEKKQDTAEELKKLQINK